MLIKNISFLSLFMLLSILNIASYITIDTLFFSNQTQNIALDNALKKTKERELFFQEFIFRAEQTILALGQSKSLKNYLNNPDSKSNLQEIFTTATASSGQIMQLRFINADGLEKIRVERKSEGKPYSLVDDQSLQNKAHRYYFQESKTKPSGHVWFSAIDLNIEHNKPETPNKPTLRAILPLESEGKFAGIIVVNYFMKKFLNQFMFTPLYKTVLINNTGHIIKYSQTTKGLNNHTQVNKNLSLDFPSHYQAILSENSVKTDQFVSKKLNTPIQNGLIIVLQLNDQYLTTQTANKWKQYSIVSTLVLIFSFGLAFFTTSILNKLGYKLAQSQKLEKLFRGTFEQAAMGIAHVSPNGKWLRVNHKLLNILGYSEEELLHKTFQDITHPDDLELDLSYVKKMLAGEIDTYSMDKRYFKKDGSIIWACLTVSLIRKKNKQPDFFISVIEEITDRKVLQEQLLLANNELKNQKERFEKLFNKQRNPSFLSNGRQILLANHSFLKYFNCESLTEFLANHKSIEHTFLSAESYFDLSQVPQGREWMDYIERLNESERRVLILNSKGATDSFLLSITFLGFGEYLVSLTNINDTIKQTKRLEDKAVTDPLTGTYNRQFFEDNIDELIKDCQQANLSLGLLMIDIDHFKKVNDTYGHDVGDDIIIGLVTEIKKNVRTTDYLIRWGGEEFILLANTPNTEELNKVAEHLRTSVENTLFSENLHITISLGLALHLFDEDIEKTIKRADTALYKAKESGRNRVFYE